uniref:Uncharacterized protein n=1 Tax=Arundo donax TaxID=35708 RepID=A0A0A9ERL1_ARUDO
MRPAGGGDGGEAGVEQ